MPRVAIAAFTLILLTAPLRKSPAGPAAPDRWLNAHTQPAVPPMAAARYAPTATLLSTGPLRGKVLVAGGFDGKECVSSTQLFNPISITWSATGSLHTGRNFATATDLQDEGGSVLICGGYDEHLGTLASAEIYEPAKQAFRALPARMNSPRELFTATRLPDGRVLLIGGYDTHAGKTLRSAELFDPKSETFTATGELRAPFGRFGHEALLLPGGSGVLVVGGKEQHLPFGQVTGSTWTSLRSAELYDVARGTFTDLPEMAFARDRPRVAWVAAIGKALIVGGKRGDKDPADVRPAEWFDPATKRFSPGPALHTGRMAHTLSALHDGTLLAAGGWCEAAHGTTATAERFLPDRTSPEGGSFVPAPSLGNSRLDAAAVTLPGGAVLVVGGLKREGREEFLADAEIYGW